MEEPVNRHRLPLLVVSIVFTALGTLMALLRFVVRKFVLNTQGVDDYLMYLGWLASAGYCISSSIAYADGVGLFGYQVDPADVEDALKSTYFVEIFYYLSIYFIKMSILVFYHRLAFRGRYWTCNVLLMSVITAQFVSTVVVTLIQCRPITYYWQRHSHGKGTCIDIEAFFYSTNGFTIGSDLAIIALPIRPLMNVSRPLSSRLSLIAVFVAAAISTISSCIRLYTIALFTVSADPMYDAAPINLWSYIEINLGIICASAPPLQGFIVRIKASLRSRLKLSSISSTSGPGARKEKEKEKVNIENSVLSIASEFNNTLKLVPEAQESVQTTCQANFADLEEGQWLSSRKNCDMLVPDRILVSTEMTQSESMKNKRAGKCRVATFNR